MICPSCQHMNVEGVRYCGRCRLKFDRANIFISHLRDHLYWVLRRANAGFISGVIAWFFIPALSRALAQSVTHNLHLILTGFLGGAFLGSVDGMVEESTPKTVRGGMLGALGGALGGLTFGLVQNNLNPDQVPWGFFMFWAIGGLFIGLTSALWERQRWKIFWGSLSGFVGGGAGGALGYTIYVLLVQDFKPEGWILNRLMEGISGGIIGVTLWFSIGMAERLIIFKRRLIDGKDHKQCDYCGEKNQLRTWYCGSCGSVLQEQAPAAKLNLPPYATLDRIRDLFLFLGRLSVTTGVIGGLAVFGVFLPVNPIFALVALVMVTAASYSLLLLFSAVAESLSIFIKQ